MRRTAFISMITLLLLSCPSSVFAATVEGGTFSSFSQFICSPLVSGVLIAIGIGCVLIEIFTMGFGVFGVTGLVAFFLYFAGHIVADGFSWIALAVFAVGMLFLMLEAFVLTGFGVSGLIGIAAIFGSVLLLSSSFKEGILTIVIAFVLLVIIMVVSIRFMKKKKMLHRFILKDRTDTESGYTAPNMDNEKYIGREGYTLTKLRPAGDMKIDGNRIDVVSEGDFIDEKVLVRVIGLDGTRIIVRPVEDIEGEKNE